MLWEALYKCSNTIQYCCCELLLAGNKLYLMMYVFASSFSGSSRGGFASKGKPSSRLDNSSSKRAPIPLLSTPILPTKRNSGTGLLGAGPADPTFMMLQQRQQQRTAMVQPLLSSQPLLQSPSCFSVAMQPPANSASAVQLYG